MSGDRFERFNGHIRAAFGSAQREAQRRRDPYIATEHLLLGIAATIEATAIDLLAPFGIDAGGLRHEVEARLKGQVTPWGAQMGLTLPAKRAINLAMEESRRLGDDFVGTEHLLVGLAGEGEGLAREVLAGHGADAPLLREEILRLRAQPDWVREA